MKKSSPNWFFTKKSWLFGWRQPVKKVTRKAPEREKSGKSWFSESPSPSECSDRSHNLRAASGHGYYRLRAFQHHPSSFTLKNLGFGVLGGMVRTKCRQQRRGAKILDFKVLESVGPSKLTQSASYCTRMLYPRVLSIANVSEWFRNSTGTSPNFMILPTVWWPIDRTHEYCILYTKYESHRSTLGGFLRPKHWIFGWRSF